MPETACLHIEGRASDPIRVVELSSGSVRIGRGTFCEVRLPEPALAEEECHLRRRGSTWHVVPVASPSTLALEGRTVEQARPLPFGVPLHVGEYSLTLRPSGAAPPSWSHAPAAPVIEVPSVAALVPEVPRVVPPVPEPKPRPAAAPSSRVRRPVRPETPATIRKRPDEKAWEARWKAVGEKLRSASAPEPTPAPTPAPAPSVVPPSARPEGWTAAELPRREREGPAPAVKAAARPEPAGFPSVKAVAVPPSYPKPAPPAPPRPPKAGLKHPTRFEASAVAPPSPSPASPPHVESWPVPPLDWDSDRYAEEPAGPGASPARTLGAARPLPRPSQAEPRALAGAIPPGYEALPSPTVGEVSENSSPTVGEVSENSFLTGGVVDREGEAPAEPSPGSSAEVSPSPSESAGHDIEPAPPPEAASPEPPAPEALTDAPHAPEPSGGWGGVGDAPVVQPVRHAGASPTPPQPPRPDSLSGSGDQEPEPVAPVEEPEPPAEPDWTQAAPFVVDTGSGPAMEVERISAETSIAAEPAALVVPPLRDSDSPRDLPTARLIFDAHKPRPRPAVAAAPAAGAKKRGKRPLPTACAEPEHWRVPLWLGWLPLTAAALVVGAGGLALACAWAEDARSAGLVANSLTRHAPGARFPIPREELENGPGPWWRSTAGNLARRAAALGSTADPTLHGQVGPTLTASRSASPLDPTARLAVARLPGLDGEPAPLTASLGLSRDAVALAWSGHQLLQAGRKDEALRLYRQAFELLATTDVARLAPSRYHDDPRLRRYGLPAEDLIAPIVRDLADHAGGSFADWSPALPPRAVVWLSAARVLRDHDRLGSDAALDGLLALPEPEPSGPLATAARAEALAWKDDYERAEALYQQAIEALPAGRIARSWWVNVADLAQRRHDETTRQKALEAANNHDPNDEITRRAVEIQNLAGDRTDTPRPGPRPRGVTRTAEK